MYVSSEEKLSITLYTSGPPRTLPDKFCAFTKNHTGSDSEAFRSHVYNTPAVSVQFLCSGLESGTSCYG